MYSQYLLKKELKGEKVEKLMKRNPISVPPNITIQDFIDHYVYQSYHHLYPVTQNSTLVGFVSLQEIKTVATEQWKTTLLETIMVPRKHFLTATPEMYALDALNLFQESDLTTLLVVSNDHLVGILTAQDLFKIVALKQELEGRAL
jgi:predicted transcriptional regulator